MKAHSCKSAALLWLLYLAESFWFQFTRYNGKNRRKCGFQRQMLPFHQRNQSNVSVKEVRCNYSIASVISYILLYRRHVRAARLSEFASFC